MLESIVSSRIRRTLVEYLLTHPTERVYLRGLAKQLGLTISPLRRELIRLEAAGMLTATDEGSMRFYLVNAGSPLFTQFQHAAQPSDVPVGSTGAPIAPPAPLVLSSASLERTQRAMRRAMPWPLLLGAIGLSVGLVVAVGAAVYVIGASRRVVALTHAISTKPYTSVTVIQQPTQAAHAGAMSSGRWRVIPGTMGGFSAGSGSESY